MPTDIFERSTITFRGTITAGHAAATSATFQLKRSGRTFASVDAPLREGAAEVRYEAPAVHGDEDNYLLEYTMMVEGQDYGGAQSYTVWPVSVTVDVTRVEDGTPFDGFTLKFTHAGASAVFRTLPTGRFERFLTRPAAFALAPEAPDEIKAWTDDKGRERKGKGVRNLKAEFVKPAKPASGEIEQFINLESAAVGQDCKGHTVTVVVAMEGDAARAPAARKGREGDPVYLQATFSRGSKRSSPAPDLLDVTGRTEDDAGKVVKAKVALGPSGEAATFRLELGQAGGDTCELKIGATPACNDATLKFINWRKLYYQVTRPDTLACPDMASITAGLAKVFVRYERYKDLTFAEADVPAAPGGSWFDGPMVGGGLAGRCVNIGASNRDFFHAKFEDTKNPIGVHVLVCHSQFDASAAEVDHFTSPDIAAATTKVAFPGGGAVHGWELDADPDGSKGYNVFSKAMHDGGEGARGVKWKSLATSGDQKDKSGDITAADVSIDYPTATSKVTVRLPAPTVAVLDAGEKVRVEMDVHYALGPYNGEAAANLQLIRSREAVGMNGTMTHELGHTMQQVLYAVPPGLAAADHGWKYDKRGHTGNHCAFGLPKALYDGGGKLTGREDCKCVMYGEGATNRPVEFCEKCAPFVTAEALTSLV